MSDTWLESEEGLACLNTHLDSDPHMWKAALNYYCAVRSQELSFAELFEDIMSRWVDTVDSAWRLCVRFKRGLQDTGKHGGYCRDQCYFIGAIKLLKRRSTLDFRLFHAGRINLEDFDRIKGLIRSKQLLLPHFLEDISNYRRLLDRIVEANDIHE